MKDQFITPIVLWETGPFHQIVKNIFLEVDTIFLANELPDTISIFSNADNTLSIDAGEQHIKCFYRYRR